jgi:hypothetical protein
MADIYIAARDHFAYQLFVKITNTNVKKIIPIYTLLFYLYFFTFHKSFSIVIMSESLGFRSKNSASQAKLISQLERQFTTITQLLYTTSVPGAVLERQVLPYIANDIVFKDPWQEGGSKQLYRIGMKGN